jgi:transposase
MSKFIVTDRKTDYLLPPSLDDWLNQDHLARFIVEVVDQLDLSNLTRQYAGCGSKAYHPATLLAILVYGYATGVFSSRKLERATYDSVAFRYIAAGSHPDHDSLATFRRRFLDELSDLFLQVLEMAREMKLLRLGHVCLDGTKIEANASRHSALSHGHIEKLEAQLKAEVQELFALAEQADQADVPDGVSLPEEIKRREDRLAAMAVAKAKIAARAEERYQREKAEYDEKMARRTAKEEATGKKLGGKPPKAPEPGARDTDQINLTDEESRIMPVAGGGFEQAYNAQAGVDAATMLVVAVGVTQATNDKEQVEPMLATLKAQAEVLGPVDSLIADTGYLAFGIAHALARLARLRQVIERQDVRLLDVCRAMLVLMRATPGRRSRRFIISSENGQIGNDDAQHVVGVAAHREAVRYFRHRRHRVFKGFVGGCRRAVQDHLGKSGDPRPSAEGASRAT